MSAPTIAHVGTSGGANNVQLDFGITGTDFDTATNVTIVGVGDIGFDIIDLNNITAHIGANFPPGTYSLTVTNPDGTSDPAGSITITDAYLYQVGTGKRFSVIGAAAAALVSDWNNSLIVYAGVLTIAVEPETYAGSIVCDFTGLPFSNMVTSISIVPASGQPVIDGHNHLLPAAYDDVGITIIGVAGKDAQWLYFNNFEIKNCAVKGAQLSGSAGCNHTYLIIHDCGVGIQSGLNGNSYSAKNAVSHNIIYNCATSIAGESTTTDMLENVCYSCGAGINVAVNDSNNPSVSSAINNNTCYSITGIAIQVADNTHGGALPDVSNNTCYLCGVGVFFHNASPYNYTGIFGGGNLVFKCTAPYGSDGNPCIGNAGIGYFNPDSPAAIDTAVGNGTTYTFLTRPLTQYIISADKIKYALGASAAISGSITSQIATTGARVVVAVYKKADDSLVATLLNTTADFVANTAKTLATIAGAAITFTIPTTLADTEYYVQLKVSGGYPAVSNPGIVDNIAAADFVGVKATAGAGNVFIVNGE